MIALPRAALKRLRTLARRGIAPGQHRGPSPPVQLSVRAGVGTIAAHLGEVVVALHVPETEGDRDSLGLSLSDLDRFSRGGSDRVRFEAVSETRGRASWQVRTIPANCEFDLVGSDWSWPDAPNELALIPSPFLQALHEAGRSTASLSGKYALNRIQIRGQAGQLIASDAKQFLVQGGFTLPFEENLLVPAVPIFGSRELLRQTVSIGYNPPWLCVGVGPWRIWLQHDADARYPDVFGVIPKAPGTLVRFHDRDIETFLEVLAMPGDRERSRPVTLDLGDRIDLRIRPDGTDEILEAPLSHSERMGPDVQVVVDSELLGRGLSLGFREFRVSAPHRPIHASEPNRIYLCVTDDPKSALPANPDRLPIDPKGVGVSVGEVALARIEGPPTMVVVSPDRETAVESNGHLNGITGVVIDPMTEAEALRSALTDAAGRIGRLIGSLEQSQLDGRALASPGSSPRQLHLTP